MVILDSHDYYAKLDCIINDNSKFHEINQDTKVYPIIKKEKSINYYVNKCLKSYGRETVKNLIRKAAVQEKCTVSSKFTKIITSQTSYIDDWHPRISTCQMS